MFCRKSDYALAFEMAKKAKCHAQVCNFKSIVDDCEDRLSFLKTETEKLDTKAAVIEDLYNVELPPQPVSIDTDTAASPITMSTVYEADKSSSLEKKSSYSDVSSSDPNYDDLPILVANEIESSLELETDEIMHNQEPDSGCNSVESSVFTTSDVGTYEEGVDALIWVQSQTSVIGVVNVNNDKRSENIDVPHREELGEGGERQVVAISSNGASDDDLVPDFIELGLSHYSPAFNSESFDMHHDSDADSDSDEGFPIENMDINEDLQFVDNYDMNELHGLDRPPDHVEEGQMKKSKRNANSDLNNSNQLKIALDTHLSQTFPPMTDKFMQLLKRFPIDSISQVSEAISTTLAIGYNWLGQEPIWKWSKQTHRK